MVDVGKSFGILGVVVVCKHEREEMRIGDNFLDKWVEAINNDNGCKLNGRGFNEAITFEIGNVRNTLTVATGKLII